MGEVFDHLRRLLGVFCTLLDKVSPWGVPWPITLGLVFPVIMSVLTVTVWLSRGRAWRVACDYPLTSTNQPCRNPVLGEWTRCHHHRPGTVRSSGSTVRALLRWQTVRSGGAVVERADIHGRGVLRDRPRFRGLLYYRGFARPPRDVVGFARTWWDERLSDIKALWRQLQDAGAVDLRVILRGPAGPTARVGVSDHVAQVIRATRVTAVLVVIGLLMVGYMVWKHLGSKYWLNYTATYAFLAAWAVVRFGIWASISEGAPTEEAASWPKQAAKAATKWFVAFIVISVLAGQFLDFLEKLVNGPDAIRVGF
ncbi:hypothetical protein NN3_33590 [Nocardia neocaledoniensis NBRC 108232]|uniref:Uncharacterized protein n=1 Tax=Nocardia neocaledoniensis TaxID=236511 RepID=A0A317NRN6_9NOCA|nr:hypothetical protein [Nocardia neocaledoniensis]PWV77533.1 hypothetical protein DFR69_103131 [Nocardia neocaledoniensis]GEM32352.1 hypothetical protein NN3_33590 [Nocardia neocaledoniensis NBRC 108232]